MRMHSAWPYAWLASLQMCLLVPATAQQALWTWNAGCTVSPPGAVAGSPGALMVEGPTVFPPSTADGFAYVNGKLWTAHSVPAVYAYNLATQMWAWQGGCTVATTPNYGTKGSPAAGVTFGQRYFKTSAVHAASATIWTFGGSEVNDVSTTAIDDMLWCYDMTSGLYTWVAGLHGVSAAAVSAGLGVFSAGNTPGHRRWIPLVVDSGSNVWTFGGEYPNTWNPTNDLWCFSFALKQWALQKGSAGGALSLVVGTRELPAASNMPQARVWSQLTIDSLDRIWLHAGWLVNDYFFADLWRIGTQAGPNQLYWTFMGGTTPTNSAPVYGSFGVPHVLNYPGSRAESAVIIDAHGDFVVHGGGLNGGVVFSDLWKFKNGSWAWIGGCNARLTTQDAPMFGARNVPAPTNRYGARSFHKALTTPAGQLFFFGGTGTDVNGLSGKSLVDLWSYDGTTGVCNCNPRALCLGINNGTSICTGVFVPNTIQLVTGLGGVINGVLTLGSASGGQVLSVMMSKSPVAVTKVLFGGVSAGSLKRFSCSSFQLQSYNASVDRLLCTVPRGAGQGLRYTITACAIAPFGCIELADQSNAFSYPAPVPVAASLRLTNNPAQLTSDLGAFTTLPVSVAFDVVNLFNATDLLQIRYGPLSNPQQYTCTIVAPTSYSTVTCLTQANSQGLSLRFTVLLGGASATSSFTINFQTAPPQIYSVHGCGTEAGNSTANCPTGGQVPITLIGALFFQPISVFVNGMLCPLIGPTSATLVECMLPVGAGSEQPVVLVAALFFSPLAKLLSYSKPSINRLDASAGCAHAQLNATASVPTALQNCPRPGGMTLTVMGSSFGQSGAVVFVGINRCSPVLHDPATPQSKLTCIMPSSKSKDLPVQVFQKNGELSIDPATVSYTQCPPGTFDDGIGCTDCTRGHFSALPGLTACSDCGVGKYNNVSRQTDCGECRPGRFASGVAATVCLDCDEGKIQGLSGRFGCTACLAGKYSFRKGSLVCADCPAGRVARADSASACVECNTGTLSGQGASDCTPCGDGHNATAGSSRCSACPAGRFAVGLAAECSPCSAGSYSLAAAARCSVCTKGKIDNSTNHDKECALCTPGSIAPSTGATSCQLCPSGSFSSAFGSIACTKCSSTEVSNGEGAMLCKKCPPASSAVGGICVCDNEFYSAPSHGPLVCLRCPPGAVTCVNGRVINPDDSWVSYGSANGSVAQIYPCPPDRCKTSSTCSENRLPFASNPLCGKCTSSNFTEVAGQCVYCPHANGGLVLLVVVQSWTFVLVTHVLAQETNGLTKIFLFWVQTLLIVISGSHSAFNWLSVFNFAPQTAGGGVCIFPQTPYEQLGVSGVFPLLFFAELAATFGVYAVYQAVRAKYRNGARPPLEATPWIRTVIVLSLSCYSQVTNSVLLYMQCVDIGSSKVVFTVPAIDCSAGNSKYTAWLVIAVLLLIFFVIGLPAFILVFLCRNRWHLENDESVATALGPLFEPYRDDRFYIEPVVLLRRTIIVVLNVSLVLSPRWKYTSFALASMIFLLVHAVMSPFRTKRDNRLESMSLLHLLGLTTLLTGESPPFSTGMEIVLSVYVVGPAVLILLYVVLDLVHGKYPIARLAPLFPAPQSRSSKLSTTAAPATPSAMSSGAPAVSAPAAGPGEDEDDATGIEMHAMPEA